MSRGVGSHCGTSSWFDYDSMKVSVVIVGGSYVLLHISHRPQNRCSDPQCLVELLKQNDKITILLLNLLWYWEVILFQRPLNFLKTILQSNKSKVSVSLNQVWSKLNLLELKTQCYLTSCQIILTVYYLLIDDILFPSAFTILSLHQTGDSMPLMFNKLLFFNRRISASEGARWGTIFRSKTKVNQTLFSCSSSGTRLGQSLHSFSDYRYAVTLVIFVLLLIGPQVHLKYVIITSIRQTHSQLMKPKAFQGVSTISQHSTVF